MKAKYDLSLGNILKKLGPHENLFKWLTIYFAGLAFLQLVLPWNPGKYWGLVCIFVSLQSGTILIEIRRYKKNPWRYESPRKFEFRRAQWNGKLEDDCNLPELGFDCCSCDICECPGRREAIKAKCNRPGCKA